MIFNFSLKKSLLFTLILLIKLRLNYFVGNLNIPTSIGILVQFLRMEEIFLIL